MCQESAVQRAYAFELRQEISRCDASPKEVAKASPVATETTAASFVAQLHLSPDSICRHGVSGCYGLGSVHICVGEHGELLGNHLALCLKCALRLYRQELADGAKIGEGPSITLGKMGVELIPIAVGIWHNPSTQACWDEGDDGQCEEVEYSETDYAAQEDEPPSSSGSQPLLSRLKGHPQVEQSQTPACPLSAPSPHPSPSLSPSSRTLASTLSGFHLRM